MFIQNYIATFNFQSITTETFIGFLTSNFPQIGKDVDLDVWVHGQGIPRDAIEPKSETLTKVKSLAEGFEGGLDLAAKDVANWSAAEWQIYLEALPLVLPHNRLATLDRDFSLSTVCIVSLPLDECVNESSRNFTIVCCVSSIRGNDRRMSEEHPYKTYVTNRVYMLLLCEYEEWV